MKKKSMAAVVIAVLYAVIYWLNSRWFDVGEPYHLYTVSWTTRQVLPVVSIVTVLLTLLGKWYLTAFISFGGYVLGIVLGELFGGFASDRPPCYPHYGWLIWGCVFILSVAAGMIVEKRWMKRQHRSS